MNPVREGLRALGKAIDDGRVSCPLLNREMLVAEILAASGVNGEQLGLTSQQARCRQFLIKYQSENGCSPSFDEIGAALKIKSKSNVFRLLGCLEVRDVITRRHGLPRSIEVLR